jgi:chromate transporter
MPHPALEVLLAFVKLGATSFGGPVAHLGYFREEFVVRRRWLDDHAYADLVSLCQFLPGPASSQVGFALGLLRAGHAGAVAAWVGFTLPSAILLVLFASATHLLVNPAGIALQHGLKLLAVAIVAQAVWGMARTLCPDWQRALIGIGAGITVSLLHSPFAQVAVIAMSGVLGLGLLRNAGGAAAHGPPRLRVSRRVGIAALALFTALLLGLPVARSLVHGDAIAMFDAFYRSGALVFGGGHVVLPMLSEAIVLPGWVTEDDFLAGYGAAQVIPGPLFSFAAYLGAIAGPSPGPLTGAGIGLAGIFLPGFLILLGALPFWESLRSRPASRGAMAGVNAAVVGLLGAALCNPVWTGSVHTIADASLAIGGFVLLVVWRAPPLLVAGLTVAAALIVQLALK